MLRILLTRATIFYLRVVTTLLNRTGLLKYVPGEATESFLTLSDVGLKPSDVVKASNFMLIIFTFLITPLVIFLSPINLIPINLTVLLTLTVIMHRAPFLLFSIGAEKFAAGVRESIAANLGAIISALEKGDEVKLVEILRASRPEVRRIVAEAQFSAGGGTLQSISTEALSYPDIDTRLLARLSAALKDKKARMSLARALGRASLSQVEEDLKVPLRKALENTESATSWLAKMSYLIFMMIPLAIIVASYFPIKLKVFGFETDAFLSLVLFASLFLSIVILRKMSAVDMDPWTLQHPSDLPKVTLLITILSIPVAILNPFFLIMIPIASLVYWYIGVKPLTSMALEELVVSLRTYSTARKEGLNRLKAMEQALNSVSHPETRKWLMGALSAWYLHSSDVLWGTVADNLVSYPGLYSLIKSLDDADKSEEDEVRDEIVELLELGVMNYKEASIEIADKIADNMFNVSFQASILPLLGILLGRVTTVFFGLTMDPMIILAVIPIPISVILGFYRASRRCGIVKMVEGVWILVVMTGIMYSMLSIFLVPVLFS